VSRIPSDEVDQVDAGTGDHRAGRGGLRWRLRLWNSRPEEFKDGDRAGGRGAMIRRLRCRQGVLTLNARLVIIRR